MIDVSTESLLALSKAARSLPGGGVAVSTIHRWRLRGIKGVKLETLLRGGIRFTSREALARFFSATTAVADGTPLPSAGISRQRQKEIESAEQEFEAAGLSSDLPRRHRQYDRRLRRTTVVCHGGQSATEVTVNEKTSLARLLSRPRLMIGHDFALFGALAAFSALTGRVQSSTSLIQSDVAPHSRTTTPDQSGPSRKRGALF